MNLDAVLLNIQGKLPKDLMAITTLKEKFEKLSDDKKQEAISQISMLNLKSPAFVFWVGNFIFGNFGVARFMIGDKVLGFIRLVICILYIITFISSFSLGMGEFSASLDEGYEASNSTIAGAAFLGILSTSLFIIMNIWWLVDLFLVGKKLRRQNFDKIMQILN